MHTWNHHCDAMHSAVSRACRADDGLRPADRLCSVRMFLLRIHSVRSCHSTADAASHVFRSRSLRSVMRGAALLCLCCAAAAEAPRRRVLVAGAGVNGAATGYFISRIAAHCGDVRSALGGGPAPEGCEGVDVVVAEAAGRVGGRLYAADLAEGVQPEVGASVYHAVNQYMTGFAERLGLETTHPYLGSQLGLLQRKPAGAGSVEPYAPAEHGGDYVFREVGGGLAKVRNIASAVWRWGLAPKHAEDAVEDLVDRLGGVYTRQRHGEAWGTAEELLEALGLKDFTHVSVEDWLRHNASVDTAYTSDVVHALARLNYGQHVHEISALAGGVACKGRGSELYGVKGGNARVVQSLLKDAAAEVHLGTRVTVDAEGCIRVSGAGEGNIKGVFDAVVLAHPQPQAGGEAAETHPYLMHTTHVTFAQGVLNATYFGGLASPEELPSVVAAVRHDGVRNPFPFRSIGRVRGSADVYKIFSDEPLDPAALTGVFAAPPAILYRHAWEGATGAYPALPPRPRGDPVHPFVVPQPRGACRAADALPGAPKVFNANALEYAVSTLETQSIGAMNAALLVLRDLGLVGSPPTGAEARGHEL
eukprot:TRINITY_DN3088_c0_g1_i2.p1 TRINITY_DN3088_c0_g1~~TRINITY_DN3088_c0_g1_i2.p1  ORF type:complete len:590 (+),score=94.28 TRINITY_DN3088_c0_g1_i2:929-2698(+)